MPLVHIPAELRGLTGGRSTVAVDGATLATVIDALDAQHPGLRARLALGNALRPGLVAVVGNETLRGRDLATAVPPSGEMFFVRAISGGTWAAATP